MNVSSAALLVTLLIIAGCSSSDEKKKRWYVDSQLTHGEQVFTQNCISCHGAKAAGLGSNWQKLLPDKSYAPPALNGSAHAWHHPLDGLKQTISQGTQSIGGYMPAFAETLSEEDKLAVVAYFQSFWSDEIYTDWLKRNPIKQ